jgi:hypothetical protein
VVVFVLIMGAWSISLLINKRKAGVLKNYIKKQFPDLPENGPILIAKQKSKKVMADIALIVNEIKKELILVFADKGKEINHKIFPFKDLSDVKPSDTILERGIFPKTYSYEKTMMIKFKDGSAYSFILEGISDRYGEGRGSDLVRNIFDPWEEKLNEIIK